MFRSVWTEVLRQMPEAELRVVGPSSVDLRAIAPARCTIAGLVEDVAAEYRAAWVAVSPAPVGSGAPLKVLESFAQARPVVARSQGFVGLPHSLGGVAIADTSHVFANKVVELLRDTRHRRTMGRAGHKYVAEHHDPSALGAELLKVHAGLGARARNGEEL
jgi:glycosyltransferase involved in cell wall biosynthesis